MSETQKPRFAIGDRFDIHTVIVFVDPNGGLPTYRLAAIAHPTTSIYAGERLLCDPLAARCTERAPRPIAVADRIRENAFTGTVVALRGLQAWVQFDGINGCTTSDLCDLVRLDT